MHDVALVNGDTVHQLLVVVRTLATKQEPVRWRRVCIILTSTIATRRQQRNRDKDITRQIDMTHAKPGLLWFFVRIMVSISGPFAFTNVTYSKGARAAQASSRHAVRGPGASFARAAVTWAQAFQNAATDTEGRAGTRQLLDTLACRGVSGLALAPPPRFTATHRWAAHRSTATHRPLLPGRAPRGRPLLPWRTARR